MSEEPNESIEALRADMDTAKGSGGKKAEEPSSPLNAHADSASATDTNRGAARRKRLAFLDVIDSGPPVHITPHGVRIDYRSYRLDELRRRYKDHEIQSAVGAGQESSSQVRRGADTSPINLAHLDGRFGPNNLEIDFDGGDPLMGLSDLVLCLSAPARSGHDGSSVTDWAAARSALRTINQSGKTGGTVARAKPKLDETAIDKWSKDPDLALDGLARLRLHAHKTGNSSLIDLADRLLADIVLGATSEGSLTLAKEAFRRVQADLEIWQRVGAERRSNIRANFGVVYQNAADLAHEIALARLTILVGLSTARRLLAGWRMREYTGLFWRPLEQDSMGEVARVAALDIHAEIADALRAAMFKQGFGVEDLLALARAGLEALLGGKDTRLRSSVSSGNSDNCTGIARKQRVASANQSDELEGAGNALGPQPIKNDDEAATGNAAMPDSGKEPLAATARGRPADHVPADEADELPLDPRRFESFTELAGVQKRLIEAAIKAANGSMAQRMISALDQSSARAAAGSPHSAGPLDGIDPLKPYKFADGVEAMMVLPPPTTSIANADARRDEAGAVSTLAGCWIPLRRTPDLAAAKLVLVAEFPHLEAPITAILNDLIGQSSVRLRPTLLVGAPGAGKSYLARRIGEVLGLVTTVVDVAGTSDSMLFGTSKKWSNGGAGLPLQSIASSNNANPLIILDEIEKAAGNTRNGHIRNSLLPYLEHSTSRFIHDRYLETHLNLSAINWMMTANDIESLSVPFRNRLRIITCAEPGEEHLPVIANNVLKVEYAEQGLDSKWLEPLSPLELDAIAAHWLKPATLLGNVKGFSNPKPVGSIRDLKRYLAGVVSARNKVMARA